ncbi:MAG: ABC transporter ATP-binding protein/permease [candidate division WOR-3 bacterium]|nr:ABC transporter ATP-binding protein/permease [candidate division WOR-3 bacterium]
MRSVIYFWKKHKIWLSFLIVFSFFNTIIALIFPYLLKDVIDGIRTNFARQDLIRFVLIIGGIGFLRAIFNSLLPYTRGRSNEMYLIDERTNIFSKILRKGHSFLGRFPAGDILQRVDHDLNELAWFSCSGIFRPIEGIFTLVIALYFLIRINPMLTLISALPISLAAVGWLKISPIMYKYYYAWRESISRTNNHLQSSFTGIKLVKSYTTEDKTGLRFTDMLTARVGASIRVIKLEALIHTLFTAIEEMGVILVLLFGGLFIIRSNLTIGEFVAFNAYIILLLDPMLRIGNYFVSKKRAQVQSERIEEIKNFPTDVADEGRVKEADHRGISMENVSFRYAQEGPLILDGVNINIKPGQKIGLAGTVGSGKTTLLQVLMRVADPTNGRVKLNGTDMRDIRLSELRSLFGYIPQEPSLFSESIYNNITFGRKIDTPMVNSAIKLAQLEGFVRGAPKGLDELIGERGLRISGGEKQRVAIARAVLNQPKILVLDDATSNLDADTEKELIGQLSKTQDTTIIIISHRLSVLSICDYIYVLDKGKIVEQGTHEVLLKNQGLYWKLYQHQIMEEELMKD